MKEGWSMSSLPASPARQTGFRGLSRRSRATWAAWLAWVSLAGNAGAGVVRLEELEAKALERRGAAIAAQGRVASARADVDVARSAYSPTAGLNADVSGSPGGRHVGVRDSSGTEYLVAGSRRFGESGAFTPIPRYGAVVALQQQLYDFGRTGAVVTAARARADAAKAGEAATRAGVIQEVRAAYLSWLAAVVLHGTAERALATAGARRRVVEARIATGLRPSSDLDPALYDEGLAELDESVARGRVRSSLLELERAAAVPLGSDSAPDPSLLAREPTGDRVAEAMSTVALEKQRSAALAQASLHEREGSPVVRAVAEAGIRGQQADVFPLYRVSLYVSVPLLDGGVSNARTTAARAEAAVLDAELREERARVTTERDLALGDLSVATERSRIAERLVASAAVRVRDAEERYDLGTGRIEAVLDANGTLLHAERELLLARVARADAILRIEGTATADVRRGGGATKEGSR
jgi:outer membrane protein TolC